jgi:uncharacterized repeat protein (TIGR01451 family)
MNPGTRLLGYLLVLAALAALLIAIPSAWATPEQSVAVQMTIPTRTPKPSSPTPAQPTDLPTSQPTDRPTSQPTDRPPPNQQATALPTVSAGTPVLIVSATPPPTPPGAAKLVLKKEVAPIVAWPGATLHYTLTLSNQGTASARQVSILDPLPEGVVPGTASGDVDAQWEGQVLKAQIPILPPASQVVIAFTANVRVNTPPGGVISNQASATASGGPAATAGASVGLPPAELPPTGGSLNGVPDLAVLRR